MTAPSAESILTIIAGVLAVLNAVMVFVLRGVRSEMNTLRAELASQLGQLTTKIDLHVIERVSRAETELTEIRDWRRDVDRQLAQVPRRADDHRRGA